MDRDRRWERTQRAYDLLVRGRAPYRAASGGRPSREPTSAARRTSSSSRRWSAGGADRPGDSVICFNFRPDRMREIVRALAEPGFGEVDRGAARLAGAGRRAGARYATLTEYEEAGPTRSPSPRAPGDDARRGARRGRRASAPCRRDREVPACDLLLQRRRRGALAGERRSSCPRRATCRPTTSSPQMSAARGRRCFVAAWQRGPSALRDHQLRQRRHGRAHGRDPGRRRGGRDGRRLPRRRSSTASTKSAASAWSPPTTATPTTCSSPTAARTRPTR